MFVDVMNQAREWVSIWDRDRDAGQFSYQKGTGSLVFHSTQYQWGNGQRAELGEHGYPRRLQPWQTLITLSVRDVCKHGVAGRYVVLYDGDGEVDFGMDAKSAAFQKGRIDVDFTPTCKRECWFDKAKWKPYCSDNGFGISIRATNPANPIRNVRVIMPNFLKTHRQVPFHPFFLKHLERYSVIRFASWQKVNSNAGAPMTPVPCRYVRFIPIAARGGGVTTVAMSEFVFLSGDNMPLEPVSVSGEFHYEGVNPALLLDDDDWTRWQGSVSKALVFDLGANAAPLGAYSWKTAHTDSRNDPVRWTLEVRNTTTQPWQMQDDRSTLPVEVTRGRREYAIAGAGQANRQCNVCNNDNRGSFKIRDHNKDRYPLKWKDRARTTDRTQAGPKGVAFEYIILLANTLGSAPWFSVHHLADNEYVRHMAELVLKTLRPDVDVYVEHSNEVWNLLFPQGQFAQKEGNRLGLADNTCVSHQRCAGLRYHAQRSVEIFAIWRQVWGESNQHRLKFILATQTSVPVVSEEVLSWKNAHKHAHALGITGYISIPGSINQELATSTPEELHELMLKDLDNNRQQLLKQRQIAQKYGLDLVSYETGTGLVQDGVIGGSQPDGRITELLIKTIRHPGTEEVVRRYLNMFRDVGMIKESLPLIWFVDTSAFSRYGSWGSREFTDQPATPKVKGVQKFLDKELGVHPLAECVVVANNARWGNGLSDLTSSFVGPPQVTSPLAGDVLVKGQQYGIMWDAGHLARPDNRSVTLHLWRDATCLPWGTYVAQISEPIDNKGHFTWVIPSQDDGSKITPGTNYIVEIRGAANEAPLKRSRACIFEVGLGLLKGTG